MYYVWRKGYGQPSILHGRKIEAQREACRLADIHKGEEFIVLRQVDCVTCEKQFMFEDLCVGEKFSQAGRTLIKTESSVVVREDKAIIYNAVRLFPEEQAGRLSSFGKQTVVKKIGETGS